MYLLFLLFVFYLSSNYAFFLIFFFVKTVCVEPSVNFALLEFQLKFQVGKTLQRSQDFFTGR